MSWMLDIFLIVFLLAMLIYWSTQGLFSAILHFGMLIAAAVLAVAVWEPLTVGFLLGRIPQYAWGVGLLAPFVIFLIVLRKISDKLIGGNLRFSAMVDSVGGAAVGAASGFFTAGFVLLGVIYLVGKPAVLGYLPYNFGNNGQVQATGQHLIVPVVSKTADFLNALSYGSGWLGGPFSTGTPLALALPDLAKQSWLYRMHEDPNANLAATPDSVSVTAVYKTLGNSSVRGSNMKSAPAAASQASTTDAMADQSANQSPQQIALPTAARQALGWSNGQELYIVDTHWKMTQGVYDSDKTLRLSSAEIHLITHLTDASGKVTAQLLAPVAYSRQVNHKTGQRVLTGFGASNQTAYALDNDAVLGWMFIIPPGQTPAFLEVRRLRLDLPTAVKTDDLSIVKAIGELGKPAQAKTAPTIGPRQGLHVGSVANNIEITNALPEPFRKGMATSLQYVGHDVSGGKDTTTAKRGGIGRRTVVEGIYCPKQKAMVRVLVTSDDAKSLLGRPMAFAANVAAPMLKDDHGDNITPTAYVWQRDGGKHMTIDMPYVPFQSAEQIPLRKMKPGDKIYLYFMVNHGVTITQYSLSSRMHQNINLYVK